MASTSTMGTKRSVATRPRVALYQVVSGGESGDGPLFCAAETKAQVTSVGPCMPG